MSHHLEYDSLGGIYIFKLRMAFREKVERTNDPYSRKEGGHREVSKSQSLRTPCSSSMM